MTSERTPAAGSFCAGDARAAPAQNDGLVRARGDALPPGLTVYACTADEGVLFREVAARHGVALRITDECLGAANLDLALGNRCISVGHRTRIANRTLRSLSALGVRYISTRSAGRDHVDVAFARSVGIRVEGVAYSPDSVADYTLMLMLMIARNARSTVTRAEVGDFRVDDARGKELRDMTVGVIGTGRIGAAVVDRLWGFGCRVLAHDRSPKAAAEPVDLDELLARSDLVTLHTPLDASTRHLLNRERIARMKDGAFVVNTGRGSLIDTESLLAALESGRLGGAALDVIEGEEGIFYTDHRFRPPEHRLLQRLQRLPNVLITPHTAYYTDHALHDVVQNTITNVLEFERASACLV